MCAQTVKNSDALRAVVDQVQPEQVRVSTKLGQSSPLYQLFKHIRSSSDLTEAQKRVLDFNIINAKLSGVDIEVT